MKLVFFDWADTLVSIKHLHSFFLDQIGFRKKHAKSNLSALEVVELKKVINKYEPCFISHSWFLVKNFYEIGAKLVIVSNGTQQEILQSLEFAPFKKFELILTADKFIPKPAPEMFEYASENLKIKLQDSVFFGDSETDKEAAKNANISYFKLDYDYKNAFKIAKTFNFVF